LVVVFRQDTRKHIDQIDQMISRNDRPHVEENIETEFLITCSVRPEPTYSVDARKAHIQGTVVLASVIQKDGTINVNGVSRSLGYGLDDAARDALRNWKCNPGKLNGQPVAVQIQIAINFHLY
jgi:TonB family protein